MTRLFGLLADASTDKIDQTVREGKVGWKGRVIFESLRNGDREAWAIVGVVVGLIVVLAVAGVVRKKLLDE